MAVEVFGADMFVLGMNFNSKRSWVVQLHGASAVETQATGEDKPRSSVGHWNHHMVPRFSLCLFLWLLCFSQPPLFFWLTPASVYCQHENFQPQRTAFVSFGGCFCKSQGSDNSANHSQQECHLERDPVTQRRTLLLQCISDCNCEGRGLLICPVLFVQWAIHIFILLSISCAIDSLCCTQFNFNVLVI